VISIDAKSVTYAGSKVVDGQQLQQEIKTYLAKNPQTGAVILNADSKLSYAKIIEVLSEMRAIVPNALFTVRQFPHTGFDQPFSSCCCSCTEFRKKPPKTGCT
jgi:hypothetical protein